MKKVVHNRIHINSINMSDKGMLTSGGLGFSIKYAPININITHTQSEANKVEGFELTRFENILMNLNSKYGISKAGWDVKICQKLKPHIGLGSTTQIEAEIVTSLLQLSCNKLPQYSDFIENYIGVESGIGLKCYLRNGFHIDFGYWRNQNKTTILNSSNAVKESLYFQLPKEWMVLLIVPKNHCSVSGSTELEFWSKILPVNETEAHKISFYTLMGLIPSIMEKNYDRFMEALNSITNLGTKNHEKNLNINYIKDIIREINKLFGFCGLSSLGPSCYSIIRLDRIHSGEINKLKKKYIDFDFILTEIAYD